MICTALAWTHGTRKWSGEQEIWIFLSTAICKIYPPVIHFGLQELSRAGYSIAQWTLKQFASTASDLRNKNCYRFQFLLEVLF